MVDLMIHIIIAIYHGNGIDGEQALVAVVVAIIRRATQGESFHNSKYHDRRKPPGSWVLWSNYRFSTGLRD